MVAWLWNYSCKERLREIFRSFVWQTLAHKRLSDKNVNALHLLQTWICSISSGANSFCPSPPKNSFRSPPVLPSTSRSMKKSRSCSTPEIRCYNCVNNGYGSKKFMIYWISTRHLYLATLPLPCFAYVVSFWLLAKKFKIMTWMHGHCHYDRVLSWSGAKQHSRRETPLKSFHKIWCNAPRTCTRHQGGCWYTTRGWRGCW